MVRFHVLYATAKPETEALIGEALGGDPQFLARGCGSADRMLKMARIWRPDVVIVDAALPGLHLPRALGRLRADRRTANARLMLLAKDADQAGRHGAPDDAVVLLNSAFTRETLKERLRHVLPIEGPLAAARAGFLQRLDDDAVVLSACRRRLAQADRKPALVRINEIAHKLAGAGGIYGFAGITSESAALCVAAEKSLAGRARPQEVARALDRLLSRIRPGS